MKQKAIASPAAGHWANLKGLERYLPQAADQNKNRVLSLL